MSIEVFFGWKLVVGLTKILNIFLADFIIAQSVVVGLRGFMLLS